MTTSLEVAVSVNVKMKETKRVKSQNNKTMIPWHFCREHRKKSNQQQIKKHTDKSKQKLNGKLSSNWITISTLNSWIIMTSGSKI